MNSHFVSLLCLFYGVPRRPELRSWALTGVAVCAALCLQVAPSQAAPLSERVESTARQLLMEQAGAQGLVEPVIDLRVAANAAALPACSDAVQVQALDVRTPTRMRLAAVCPAQGWQREWIVRAEMSAMVVVAAVDVPAQRMLVASDLAVERRRVLDMAAVVSDPSQAAGQSSSRALRSGQLLQPRWLSAPLLVQRGDRVVILARNEGIEVQAAGEALEAGRLNGAVRVRNATTGKVIRARVSDAGVVEPENMGGVSRP